MNTPRPRILVVEDSPSDALLARHALRDQYEVDLAHDGREAMERLKAQRYTVVITDFRLPDMTGLEILAWIQRERLCVPVIVASSQGCERTAADALKQGAYDYVIKSEDSINSLPIVARQALRRFELEQRNRLLTQIVENATDAILTVDTDGIVVTANQAVRALFGWAPEEAVGRPVATLLAAGPGGPGIEPALASCRAGEPWRGELSGRRRDGSSFPIHLSASPLRGGGGDCPVIAIVSDISERRKLMEELERLSITDDLTRLYNHRYFREKFRYEYLRATRYRQPLSCIMADIDFFKTVNDTYGHPAGDEVLKAVAGAIRRAVRDVDIVTRYGGEEFAVLLPNTSPAGARSCAEHVWSAIGAASIRLPQGVIHITASVGVATLDRSCRAEEDLLRHADQALYAAKRRGRNNVCSWNELQEEPTPGAALGAAASVNTLRRAVKDLALRMKTRQLEAARPMVFSILEASPSLQRHVAQVIAYSDLLGRAAGLGAEDIETVRFAALFHDIGKLAVPDRILLKSGPLTPEERRHMNEHILVGEELATEIGVPEREVSIIRHHHERFDGEGIPDGVRGDRIPLGSRIIAIADAYESMTAGRPYRAALAPAQALEEIQRCSGAQFDPALVQAFHAALQTSSLAAAPFSGH